MRRGEEGYNERREGRQRWPGQGRSEALIGSDTMRGGKGRGGEVKDETD